MKWILLPGMDGTGELFQPFLEVLPKEVEAEIISYPKDQFLDYRELIELVRRQLPFDEPFLLVAQSFSGPIGIHLASTQIPNLRGLVLTASFASCPVGHFKQFLVRTFLRNTSRGIPPRWVIEHFMFGSDCPKSLLQIFHDAVSSVQSEVLKRRLEMILASDFSPDFRKITVPILYLAGLRDRLVPKAVSKRLREFLPEMRVEIIDSPHFILQREPEKAYEVISRFSRG